MSDFSSYFQRLSGLWKLERKISDGSGFVGEACFEKQLPNEYRLSESGTLTLANGTSCEARREWIWRLSGKGLLDIFYAENPPRAYHSLHLTFDGKGWVGSALHLCPPDTYEGRYQFFQNRFDIDQIVSGPKKDYSMRSIYRANTVGLPDH